MCSLNRSAYDACETDRTGVTTSADAAMHVCDGETPCKKCGCEERRVYVRDKSTYCKACFLSVTTHKFRSTLGKSKSVHSNDVLLAGYSGKANSTVLAHLIKASEKNSSSRKLPLRCKLLYIDDGMVKGRTPQERQDIRTALAREAKSMRLTMYIISLANGVTANLSEEIEAAAAMTEETRAFREDAANVGELEEMFDRLESDTAKDDFLRHLRRKLLVSVARRLNCNKVFLAETSVDLAIKVLGDVSTGRGSQLSTNVGFSDARCKDIILLRPLKDLTENDVANYLDCCDLTPVLASREYDRSFPLSIRSIARNFVERLNSEFRGTVSTIYRTSEKLATKTEGFDNPKMVNIVKGNINAKNVCVLCELPVQVHYPQEGQPSVVQAKMFSKLVSTVTDSSTDAMLKLQTVGKQLEDKKMNATNASEKKSCDSGVCPTPRTQIFPAETLEKHLCYGCKLIFFASNQTRNMLPNFLLDAIRQKSQEMMSLKAEIQDFLL